MAQTGHARDGAKATATRNAPLIGTLAFVAFLLLVNYRIFTHPIVETGDFAANSLLVAQARHFKLLTGHYSRWHFMHPGPAFLYLFALGEFLFHKILPITPAPFNAQLLMMILFNGALLYATLRIFRKHTSLPVPLALLATGIVTLMVNSHDGPDMLISNWMPDVLIFPAVLFVASAASVLADDTSDLPWLAFSGMLLIHAHVAQFLFVGVLGGGTIGYILLRAARRGKLGELLAGRRRHWILAGAIILVFALPPLLEIVLDRPNNLDGVLAYLAMAGKRHSIGLAIAYTTCFLFFIGAPEVALTKSPMVILSMGLAPVSVVLYWLGMAMLLVFVLTGRGERKRQPAGYLSYLMWIMTCFALLFVYWGTRIDGGFYAFNGRVFYALQVLVWFVLLAGAAAGLTSRVRRIVNYAAVACLLMAGVSGRSALVSVSGGDQPEVRLAAAAAPKMPFGRLDVVSAPNDWPWAAGVANSMQRMGKPFCVSPTWSFMFSRANQCPDFVMADQLAVSTNAGICEPPCQNIYRGAALSVTQTPAEPLTIPLRIGQEEMPSVEKKGFYGSEGSFCWGGKHASVRFLLSQAMPSAPCFRMAIEGQAFPGRPMRLSMNGRNLGTLAKSDPDTASFVISRDELRPGENTITLDTERAGPVGHDPREIGFAFRSLSLRAAGAGESCTVDPAGAPDYLAVSADWAPSCYPPEEAPRDEWRWCGADSFVTLHNRSAQAKTVTLLADFSTDHEEAAPLYIRSDQFRETLTVSRKRVAFQRTVLLAPGAQTIFFKCLAAKSNAPDPRTLVLRIDNFRVEPAGYDALQKDAAQK